MKLSSIILFGLLFLSINYATPQSDPYWSGEARPFAILGHSQSYSNFTIFFQNIEDRNIILGQISMAGNGSYLENKFAGPPGSYVNGLLLHPGEKGNVSFNLSEPCRNNAIYEYQVNFTYSDPDNNLGNQAQVGKKTLVGKCHSPTDDDIRASNTISTAYEMLAYFPLVFLALLLWKRDRIMLLLKQFASNYKWAFAAGVAFLLLSAILGFLFPNRYLASQSFGDNGYAAIFSFEGALSILLLAILAYLGFAIGKKSQFDAIPFSDAFVSGMLSGGFFLIGYFSSALVYFFLPVSHACYGNCIKVPLIPLPPSSSLTTLPIMLGLLMALAFLPCGILSAISYKACQLIGIGKKK